MPTGYTAKLSDGEQSFEEFVWSCARGMGALVMMRDDPQDAPVLHADNFYERTLVSKRTELAEWDGSGATQRRAMYEAQKLANEKSAADSRAKCDAIAVRYDAMAERVREWVPPSPEHVGLRSFMLEQIASSREHDCSPYEPNPLPEFDAWQARHRADLVGSIARYASEAEKERDRNESRQRWVDQLRESVPQPKGGVE